MSYINFDKYGPEYKQLWDTMKVIRDDAELTRVSNKIRKYADVYKEVEKATGVPWQMVGVIHLREAGEQDIGRFKGVLHNGELIVGTGKRTRLVPARRGPFNTWFDAAVDALKLQGFEKIKPWPVERMLWALEPFNGYGYRNGPHAGGVKYPPILSPYLWASTNHQQRGKYTSDNHYDPSVMDTQVGCAALLKYLDVGKSITVDTHIAGGAVVATTVGGAAVAAHSYWDTIQPYLYNNYTIGTLGLISLGYIGYHFYKGHSS